MTIDSLLDLWNSGAINRLEFDKFLREISYSSWKPIEVNRLGLVDVAVIRGDECDGSKREFLVVTNRNYGGFTTPGGKIDPGEDHVDAAVRELEEETGLKAEKSDLIYIGCYEHMWRGTPVYCHGYVLYFDMLGEQEPKQVEEGTKPFWVSRDRLLDPGDDCIAQSYYGWLMGKMNWDD